VASVGWLVKGEHSDETIITAPDAPRDVGASVAKLDLALNGFTGPKPAWYRAIEKTGYWWYLICMIVGVAVVLPIGSAPIGGRVAAGMGAGILLAPISGALIGLAVRAADRRKSGTTPEKIERKLKRVARRIAPDAHGTVDLVLDRDPQREAQVHDLLWGTAAGSDAAFNEIEALIAEVAPEVAAERKAAAEDLLKQLDDAKKRTGL
jgi:hypothetical protein